LGLCLPDNWRTTPCFRLHFWSEPLTPSVDNPRWGGYRIHFKIIERDKHRRFNGELDPIRRNATMTGPLQQRVFTIDISRWEFCEGKTETKLEEFTIYVYTPSKFAGNLFGINESWARHFHPYGWAAGPCELKTPVSCTCSTSSLRLLYKLQSIFGST